MSDDYYDHEWVPEPAAEMERAAQLLESFDPDADIPPRTAFLLAKWLHSYAADITEKARAARETPDVDENALNFVRHINGDNK